MIDFIELGGEKRPVKFGLNTLRIFTKQHKISLNSLGNLGEMTFDILMELMFAGYKEGVKSEGQQLQLSIDEFCTLLDENGKFDEMLTIFADQFGGGEDEGNQEAPETGSPGTLLKKSD